MGNLNEYKTQAEKERFYNYIKIETEQEFDKHFNQIQTNSKGYAFRSINEAKFKLYSSAQRQWIWNDLSNTHPSFCNYILLFINKIRQNGNIISFFDANKIPINDFVILALLQHYRQPSPLIDITIRFRKKRPQYQQQIIVVGFGQNHLINQSQRLKRVELHQQSPELQARK